MTVALIGSNGQLGADLVEEYRTQGEQAVGLTHADIDIRSLESIRQALLTVRPEVIVNTAAMHHVENCEKEPARAYEVNAIGARNLATVARELGAKLVHVSTDYVFDGAKQQPYVEDDRPAPLNVYGNTKLAGEAFLQGSADKYFIVRTSALYGRNPCRAKGGKNFVDLMLKLAAERDEVRVVDDEIVSPTSTAELARQIVILSRTNHYGLYHATAEGSCSWFQFAKTVFELRGIKTRLSPASPNEFPAKVPRPKYSVLENRALKALGINSFQPWQQGLVSYLDSQGQGNTGSRAAANP
jgi:dTDP-4-dehydrorhamnose reductase